MSQRAKRPPSGIRFARDFVAKYLLRSANALGADDPRRIEEAIGKLEQAWALTHDARIAIQLATMYDRVNRNDDALVVLREAFRRDPRHPLLRHHAAITLLRHGTAPDVRDFFASVLKIDPDDAFAQFVMSLLDSYDVWVDELVSSIVQKVDGRRPFIISCPVWGQPFGGNFAHYICAALLSPNNLPALAKRYSIHLVIFTTAETEAYLTADPLFALLERYATVRFVHYTEKQIGYRKSMEAHYGREEVFYSQRSLAFYYARNCKFALMSCAHYVALAAGRAGARVIVCDEDFRLGGRLLSERDEVDGKPCVDALPAERTSLTVLGVQQPRWGSDRYRGRAAAARLRGRAVLRSKFLFRERGASAHSVYVRCDLARGNRGGPVRGCWRCFPRWHPVSR